jgi:hypothetical protein
MYECVGARDLHRLSHGSLGNISGENMEDLL